MVTAKEIIEIAKEQTDIQKYMDGINLLLKEQASELVYGDGIKFKTNGVKDFLVIKIKEELVKNGFNVEDSLIEERDYRESNKFKAILITINKDLTQK